MLLSRNKKRSLWRVFDKTKCTNRLTDGPTESFGLMHATNNLTSNILHVNRRVGGQQKSAISDESDRRVEEHFGKQIDEVVKLEN